MASAAAAFAVIAGLASEDTGTVARGCEEAGRRLRELETLLEAGNTRALDQLPWLKRCLGAAPSEQMRALLRQIEALDFPAALDILRRLDEGTPTGPR